MRMTPATELKPLQVRLPGPVLEEFKAYAQEQGRSMASLVLGWIEAALAGSEPTPGPVQLQGQVDLLSSLLVETKSQTALLQELVSRAGGSPYGGTGSMPVVVTPSSASCLAAYLAQTHPDGFDRLKGADLLLEFNSWLVSRDAEPLSATRLGLAAKGVTGLEAVRSNGVRFYRFRNKEVEAKIAELATETGSAR